MAKRIINVFFDTVNSRLVDQNDQPLVSDQWPLVYESERPQIRLTLRGNDSTAASPYIRMAASDLVNVAIDDDFDGTSPVMAKTTDASINYGAWSEESKATGKLSIDIDASATAFSNAIGTARNKACWLELRTAASGESWPSSIFQMRLNAANVVDNASITE